MAVAAVVVTAVVASAGTAGAAIGLGAAMAIGGSGATAAACTTVATVGCYGVAAGIGLCAAGDVEEILTDHNFVRDDFMGGNQKAYDFTKTMLYAGSGCITTLAAENPGMKPPSSRDKTISNILDNSEFTNHTGKVENYNNSSHGYEYALRDFKSLNLKNIKLYDNGTLVGYLPDGRTVNLHAGKSVGGAPSLEIYCPLTETRIKIRY